MSWSDRLAAIARIDGWLRAPLRYAVSAAARYCACCPAILGTWYTSGNAVRQPAMPWHPWHICTRSRPRFASPEGACALAAPAASNAAPTTIAFIVFIIVIRDGGRCTRPRAVSARPGAKRGRSTLEILHLVGRVLPRVGVRRRRLALDDRTPQLGELGIDRLELLLVRRHVVLGEDRLDRALGDAQRAVDALVGIDHQEIGALAEAVDGADVDAVGVLAPDARLGDDVSHERERGSALGDTSG